MGTTRIWDSDYGFWEHIWTCMNITKSQGPSKKEHIFCDGDGGSLPETTEIFNKQAGEGSKSEWKLHRYLWEER